MVKIVDLSGFVWSITDKNLTLLRSAMSDDEFRERIERYSSTYQDDLGVTVSLDQFTFDIKIKTNTKEAEISFGDKGSWEGSRLPITFLIVSLAFLCRLTSELAVRKQDGDLIIEEFFGTYDLKWTLNDEVLNKIQQMRSAVLEHTSRVGEEVSTAAKSFGDVAGSSLSFDWDNFAVKIADKVMKFCPHSLSWTAEGLNGKDTTVVLAFLCWLTSFAVGSVG